MDINNSSCEDEGQLMLQWGKAFGRTQTTFPIAFNNLIFHILICPNSIRNGYSYICSETYVYSKTLTYFYRDCNNGTESCAHSYVAIGY